MGSLHLSLASFSCCARTPTSHTQLRFCTALLLPALPKVHSAAEGGPLNLPKSLVIMLDMLDFFILFVQQYIIIICSHPRPLQHTSPQYVGLDVHLASMPQLQTGICSFQAMPETDFRPRGKGRKLAWQGACYEKTKGAAQLHAFFVIVDERVNLCFRSKRQRKTLNQCLYLRPGITSRRIIYRVLSPYTERGFGVLHWHWGLRCVCGKLSSMLVGQTCWLAQLLKYFSTD